MEPLKSLLKVAPSQAMKQISLSNLQIAFSWFLGKRPKNNENGAHSTWNGLQGEAIPGGGANNGKRDAA